MTAPQYPQQPHSGGRPATAPVHAPPPHAAAAAPSGRPWPQPTQGPPRNLVAILVAGAGLLLIGASMFLPLAQLSFGDAEDAPSPLEVTYFGYTESSNLFLEEFELFYLDLEPTAGALDTLVIGLPLLVMAAAAAIASSASPRLLVFGRLAALGLGVTTAFGQFARVSHWKSYVQSTINATAEGRGFDGEDEDAIEEAAKVVEDFEVSYQYGLWVLLVGIAMVAASVLLVRTRPAHPPLPPVFGQQHHAAAPGAVYQAPPTTVAPPHAPGGQPQVHSEGIDPSVHDDPPSLSIFKPPKDQRG
ncbi:MAG: hypothetical protein ACRDXX_16655 [Stackebrandtia sp.]